MDKIKQILPADNWEACYGKTGKNGEPDDIEFTEPVICWALIVESTVGNFNAVEEDRVVGMIQSDCGLYNPETDSNFLNFKKMTQKKG